MKNKMQHRSKIVFTVVLIALIVVMGCSGGRDDDVIARVGNKVLAKSEMKKRMEWEGFRPDQDSDFVERWVNRELLYQEAKRLGLDRDSEELKWELELVEKDIISL